MRFTFYDNVLAYNPARARIVLYEKGVPFKTIEMNLFLGDQLKADYLRINPNGWAPTLIDTENGKILLDSCSAVDYIDNFDGKPLGGENVNREIVDEWVGLANDWDGNVFNNAAMSESVKGITKSLKDYLVSFAEARKKENPDLKEIYEKKIEYQKEKANPSEAEIARAKSHLASMLEKADATLGSRPFLAGEAYSLADALFTAVLVRVLQGKQEEIYLNQHTNVVKYFEEIRKRPSFDKSFAAVLASSTGPKKIIPALLWSSFAKTTGWY
ncbi:Ganglioside induced differentiation associated protein [Nowakowskiella sp. JEL0078]|nr:Ganglioside induced differentiation associated protein [Nowakowskiella sp. JEL0078]